jgi:hypothetical protein
LQLQYQVNLNQVGLDRNQKDREMHDALLRLAVQRAQPGLLPPKCMLETSGTGVSIGNPTDHVILIAPILVDQQVAGLVEVWQDATRGPDAQRGFLQFMLRMANLASELARKAAAGQ